MKQKSFVRVVTYILVAILLFVNITVAAASSEVGKPSAKVFTVYPSGGDDTGNIQHAFDQAVAAGPGSTVKLAVGNFTTRFIEVWDFDGFFVGSGQKKTVIDTFADQDCQALIDNQRTPSLFNFFGGNVRVSDLSFHITPAMPCSPFLYGGFQRGYEGSWINVLTIMPSPFIPKNDCAVVQKERVSASITRVTFHGEQGVPLDGDTYPVYSNIGESILIGGSFDTTELLGDIDCNFFFKYAQGSFNITETTQQNTLIGMVVEYTYNSPVLIRGNSYDLGTNGIILEHNSGSRIEVSNNHFKAGRWSGIWVWHGDVAQLPSIDTPAVYDIHHNEIEAYETNGWWTSGIVVWDDDNMGSIYFPSTGKTAVVVARNNRITMTPLNPTMNFFTWGVWLEGVDDALIVNNKISGAGTAAVYAGMFGPSHRGKILANDLTGFSAVDGSPYKIVLDWGTEKYIVTGEPVANVANYGTDNLIAGKKFKTLVPFAQGKLDKLKELFGNLKMMKGGFHLGQR